MEGCPAAVNPGGDKRGASGMASGTPGVPPVPDQFGAVGEEFDQPELVCQGKSRLDPSIGGLCSGPI
jgi:hypothetical protein